MTSEITSVAKAYGHHLDEDFCAVAQRASWSRLDAHAESSLLRDYRRGRRTELEDRFGPIVGLADHHRVEIPVLRVVYRLAVARLRLDKY